MRKALPILLVLLVVGVIAADFVGVGEFTDLLTSVSIQNDGTTLLEGDVTLNDGTESDHTTTYNVDNGLGDPYVQYLASTDGLQAYAPGGFGFNANVLGVDSEVFSARAGGVKAEVTATLNDGFNVNSGVSIYNPVVDMIIGAEVFFGTSVLDPQLFHGTTTPVSPSAGDLWYDENGDGSTLCDDDECYLAQYDGTEWDYFATSGSLTDKFFSFRSLQGTSGTAYALNSGFYIEGASLSDFDPLVNFGDSTGSYAAHVYVIASSLDLGTNTIRVTGTSITDTGTRTTSDFEDLVFTAASAGTYMETSKKFLGTVSIDFISGNNAVTYCYGWAKYWDNLNRDFTIKGIEANWLAAKNDASFDIELYHHDPTATWGCSGGFSPPILESIEDSHSTEHEARADDYGAWKITGLNYDIDGDGSEGIVIGVITGTSAAIDYGAIQLQISQ